MGGVLHPDGPDAAVKHYVLYALREHHGILQWCYVFHAKNSGELRWSQTCDPSYAYYRADEVHAHKMQLLLLFPPPQRGWELLLAEVCPL